MTQVDIPAGSLDAIVCLYAIIYVPLDEQPFVIQAMHRRLRSDGWLLISVGNDPWTGTEEDWCDVPGALMYWSHESSKTYLAWMRTAGIDIEWQCFVPEGDGGHVLIFARASG